MKIKPPSQRTELRLFGLRVVVVVVVVFVVAEVVVVAALVVVVVIVCVVLTVVVVCSVVGGEVGVLLQEAIPGVLGPFIASHSGAIVSKNWQTLLSTTSSSVNMNVFAPKALPKEERSC